MLEKGSVIFYWSDCAVVKDLYGAPLRSQTSKSALCSIVQTRCQLCMAIVMQLIFISGYHHKHINTFDEHNNFLEGLKPQVLNLNHSATYFRVLQPRVVEEEGPQEPPRL